MTEITDADLRRLGFTRITDTAWRKYSSDSTTIVGCIGLRRSVSVGQMLYGRASVVYCPHIKTAEQLEALCNSVLENSQ